MVAGSTRDITERKRVNDSLRDTKARLDATLTVAEIATWTWDIQNDRVVADRNSQILFLSHARGGRRRTDCLLFRAIHPEDLPRVEHAVAEALQKGSYQAGYRLVKPDGTFRWVVARGHVEYDASGRPSQFPGVLIDITERKRAEENSRESEARFRAFITATSDVLYRMSPDWSEMLQLRGSDFLANTEKPSRTWLQDYIYPADQPQVMAAIQKAIQARSVFEFEHRVRRVDGTLGWTFSRAVPLLDAHDQLPNGLALPLMSPNANKLKKPSGLVKPSEPPLFTRRRLAFTWSISKCGSWMSIPPHSQSSLAWRT